jgi:hypothetical protein
MKKIMIAGIATSLLFSLPTLAADNQPERQLVEFPDMMVQHMLGNMRDHLLAIHEIQTALAKGELDKAGDIAEQRIGMSSLVAHHAAQMAPYMPKTMQDIGTEMHHAASRFAIVVKEGDTLKALDGLSKITQQCVACHAAYRIN